MKRVAASVTGRPIATPPIISSVLSVMTMESTRWPSPREVCGPSCLRLRRRFPTGIQLHLAWRSASRAITTSVGRAAATTRVSRRPLPRGSRKKFKTSGSSEAWYRARFGTERSRVRIRPSRPFLPCSGNRRSQVEAAGPDESSPSGWPCAEPRQERAPNRTSRPRKRRSRHRMRDAGSRASRPPSAQRRRDRSPRGTRRAQTPPPRPRPSGGRGGVDNKEESVYSVSWSTNLYRIWRQFKRTSGRG